MSRWNAAARHLLLTALVGGALLGLALWLWYPAALVQATGAARIAALAALVVLLSGPLLTLLVFRAGKAGMRFDLVVIALVQAGLLGYGLYTLAQGRPVFVVGAVDRFEVVRANELTDADLAQAPEAFRSPGWTGPRWVAVQLPEDPKAREQAVFESLSGRDLHLRPRYYVPVAQAMTDLRARALPVANLLPHLQANDRSRLLDALRGGDPSAIRALPVVAGAESVLVLLAVGEAPGPLVRVDPWAAQDAAEKSGAATP